MALADNKKQLGMIVVAVAVGIIASVMIGMQFTRMVNEETQKLAFQYEQMQKQKEKQYSDQIASMNQKIAMVEERARKAGEEAAKAAQQKQAATAAPVPEKKVTPSLALRMPQGKRAITVQIDVLEAVGGLVNPGDFVDVIAHLDVPAGKDNKKDKVTAMIFQQLQILAVNTNIDQPGGYAEQQKQGVLKITFAVDPQEAGLLAFAERNGKLELVLRSPNETKRLMLSAATWSTLAEYVLENQGADIQVFTEKKEEATPLKIETEKTEEVKPYIQIYRGGREL